MHALEEFPVVFRCDGLRARPSAVQLIANGVWRVDWVGGLVSLYREDPRRDLQLGYEPKHLRWWRPAPVDEPERPLLRPARSLSLVLGSVVDRAEGSHVYPESRPVAAATFDDGAQVAGLDQSAGLERMADATMRLARRNEALEDFAALVAHELKSPLETALLADDPRRWISSALDLVDALLQVGTESPDGAWASLSDCLAAAACCLDPIQFTVAADEDIRFPLPPGSLSVILRNLLANAAAAQARRVDVFTRHHGGEWSLVVDDDGVGLGTDDNDYEHGSGIGLELCRRIAGRSGGRLELVPRDAGGTRAILTMEGAA